MKELRYNYQNIVYFNGINEFEAKTIAEVRMVNSEYRGYFDRVRPMIREDDYAASYPDFWFVDFTLRKLYDAPSYLVVINKSDGEIIHAGEYWPKRTPELQWVFDRTAK